MGYEGDNDARPGIEPSQEASMLITAIGLLIGWPIVFKANVFFLLCLVSVLSFTDFHVTSETVPIRD